MSISRRRFVLAGLMLLVGISGCERREQSAMPTAPEPLLGGLLGGLTGTSGGTLGGYTLANDNLLRALLTQPLQLNQIIGVNGGTISVLGHSLIVPPGAVSQPTIFAINVLPSGYVEVHLTATLTDLLRGILNIGSQGFDEPVTVKLSYARSTNIKDPSKLIVLRAKGTNGLPQPMPSTVDTVNKTVTADLDHFSRYFIAFPN